MTEPLRIRENDNDEDDKEYEGDSHKEEDSKESAEDYPWGIAITMSW